MLVKRIGIVCTLALVLIIAGYGNTHAQTPTDTAVIYTWGHAEVTFKTGTGPERLTTGMRLGVGDTIETGEKAKVELKLSDGSVIIIGANSRVVIKQLDMVEVTKVSTSTFELVTGRIRAIVTPFVNRDSRFTIETSNATVGVRGTDFGVTRDPGAGITHLLTVGGTVYLTLPKFPDLPPILVIGGEEITVWGDTRPKGPTTVTPEAIYQFLQKMMYLTPGGGGNHGGGNDNKEGPGQSRGGGYKGTY